VIHVIHKKNKDKYDNVIYVGRGSVLGNPYTSIKGRETLAEFVVDSRKESIEKFREYLLNSIEGKNKNVCDELNRIYLEAMKGDVYLSCYCFPRSCHADVIKEIIDLKINPPKDDNQLDLFNKD